PFLCRAGLGLLLLYHSSAVPKASREYFTEVDDRMMFSRSGQVGCNVHEVHAWWVAHVVQGLGGGLLRR
ncbi:MAG: hypothetical protein ACPIOQ_60400, partial [Promethearchaeia archaeon]